jgi:hypothetical protein
MLYLLALLQYMDKESSVYDYTLSNSSLDRHKPRESERRLWVINQQGFYFERCTVVSRVVSAFYGTDTNGWFYR